MSTPLVVALMVASFGYAIAALMTAARDRPAGLAHLVAAGAIEALVVVQAILAVVRLLAGTRPASVPTFLGYLIGSLIILPFGVLWALEERTRWSSVVLAVAAGTLAVVALRMSIVWRTSA